MFAQTGELLYILIIIWDYIKYPASATFHLVHWFLKIHISEALFDENNYQIHQRNLGNTKIYLRRSSQSGLCKPLVGRGDNIFIGWIKASGFPGMNLQVCLYSSLYNWRTKIAESCGLFARYQKINRMPVGCDSQ